MGEVRFQILGGHRRSVTGAWGGPGPPRFFLKNCNYTNIASAVYSPKKKNSGKILSIKLFTQLSYNFLKLFSKFLKIFLNF